MFIGRILMLLWFFILGLEPTQQVLTSIGNDHVKVQQDFFNFFDSIKKNDSTHKKNFRSILEEETRREHQAFDSAKDEFRSVRFRSSKQRQFHAVLKREEKKTSAEVPDFNLASSQGAPNQTGIQLPHPRYRREGTGSTPTAPKYIECGYITEDRTFQSIFRSPEVLLPFLNGVFQDNPIANIGELTEIKIPGGQQSPRMLSEKQYHIIHDVLARDAKGNAYIIEMERAFGTHDLVRFQYSASRAFVSVIDERLNDLRRGQKGKTEAAEAVTKAVAEAEGKAKVKSKPVSHQELFKAEETPTVIAVILVEDGLAPAKLFEPEFSTGKYTVVSGFEKLGKYSKMIFVYIDLKIFAKTKKLANPETSLDRWCQLLWTVKDGKIPVAWWDEYKNFPGIKDAAEMLVKMPYEEIIETQVRMDKEATLVEKGREEGRIDVAREMLKQNLDDATIINLTKISADQLKKLKSSL